MRGCAVFLMELRDRAGVAGTVRRLSPEGRFSQGTINQSGTQVAFWGSKANTPGHHIWVADIPAGTRRRVTSGCTINGHPFWFPDGRRFACFSSAGASETSEWSAARQFAIERPATNLWIIDAWTGERTRVTKGDFVDERPCVRWDGREIIFVSNRSGGLNLWRIQPDGDGLRQVTRDSALDYRPCISPDGRRLAYFTMAADRTHQLALLSWPDARPVRLPTQVDFAWAHGPFWSTDNRTVLVHARLRSDPVPHLWLLDVVDGGVRRLELPGVRDCSHGTWDAKEQWLVFDGPPPSA